MRTKRLWMIAGFLVFSFYTGAKNNPDNDKFGADSAKCVENLSLYKEFVKQKNYKDALPGWRAVFEMCPKSTRSIYSDGIKIYQYLILKEKDPAIQNKYVDTLMLIYDQRIQYFGNNKKYPEGWILGRKGNDLYKYRNDNVEAAYKCLAGSVELMGVKSEMGILTPFMHNSIRMFDMGKHSAEKVVDDYVLASDIVDQNLANLTEDTGPDEEEDSGTDAGSSKKDKLLKVKENLDNLFVTSKPATCETIVPIFKPKFEAKPDDVELIKKIVRLLNRQDCTEDPLFFNVSARLNELEPNPIASYALARMSRNQEKYAKAVEYYTKAVELETVDSLKAQYLIEMAAIVGTKLGNPAQGRTYALRAAELKKNWGIPYVLIGTFYGSSASSCGDNECIKKTVYWAAVDKLNYAKSIDPKVADEANKYINTFSLQFPGKEECFFYGIEEGQSYTVGCWINETTKARF
ncbi:MAG: hypothetical protein KJ607_04810 [Bacteroidetes bacterium]|nr:hypothetical protein [Bacteroidota bacterium]